uniref:Uncharacterized protein n=1 Tax=Setaria digitata TaxID=48799 RepID=A0A915PC27_9BILA
MLTSPEGDGFERQLLSIQKRAGARAFGSSRSQNFENLFFPSNKRHQTFSPYYYYQQPKRGGGHPFYAYLSQPVGDVRFIEGMPFYKKRTALSHDSEDYIY